MVRTVAEKNGYIKLDRNMERWRWWKNRNTLQVFIWLLFHANVVDHDFENEIIHRGQVATSITSISNACSLTTQQVRTAILHLKSTGEITIKSNNRYQVITIVNYKQYQDTSTIKTTRPSTNEQQTNNKQITNEQQTNQQQYKNDIKNDKNERKKRKVKEKKSASSSPLDGGSDAPKATRLKPIDEGTDDDIPAEFRDFCKTYADYWRFRNR